ncbi:bifunctional DNA-binding transcriptional regulator/O6-methylguanine-DNA methyltransferase Ada [Phenylobacterium sp. LH3H17]|uniref:bifunctional DNA-binding transcriptional regulator/O6-methylguanine-DNA methyltransferase Ada n=1 Tax=Phenylobacterium sp. LH3H17 TaxID=2903901 RepID=UPI0020CA0E22|nr:bifunctional DNA-binding transcriptional regulator/O6-methylguanine-DNA methyltransferase Ada [Phenylobacterium sp. LH3H17]UTP38117.1 bifunctional DNA-binding transcriptional regulator/O6-methylguanine-DNA methyltransferase Ada [Phenylobacterium sp. LH3H17]
MQIATDEDRWAAVLAKDHAANDLFFYSVRTTGVYCRASCAARPARRENVAFHQTTADAKAAGFRPCKRCRPDEPAMAERHAAMVGEACRAIEAAEEAPSLAALSSLAGMSPYYFHRVFKSITGVTPKAYAEGLRTRKVREALTAGGTVTGAIYDAGFNSGGRFYAKSAQVLGMTPTRFRAGGETATIRFAIGECSLGAILVAATEVGICSILLGDDPEALVHDLQDRFDRATLVGADPEFEALVAKVVGFVEQPGLGLDLPLDVRGTAFQQRVWQALRDIPAGETAGYLDIATKIGSPKAVRAVAQACAANHIAVAIPCHRVVRTDGALSGYRWGVERKRALLDREAAA